MSDSRNTNPQATPTSADAPAQSGFQRIIGVLISPGETFGAIVRRPDIMVPLLVLVIVTLISVVVVVPKIDFETAVRAELEKNADIAADDVERMAPIMAATGKVFAYLTPLFGVGILAIIAGVLLLGFRLMGGEGRYKQAFSITLYAWMPQVIKGIVATIIALLSTEISAERMQNLVSSNLGALVDPKQQMVAFALLSWIDLFTIWTVVLLIVGLALMSGLSKAKSAAIVISLWVVMIIISVGFAALGAARMKQT